MRTVASALSLDCARCFTGVVIMRPVVMISILQGEKRELEREVRPLASGPAVAERGSERGAPEHAVHALPSGVPSGPESPPLLSFTRDQPTNRNKDKKKVPNTCK